MHRQGINPDNVKPDDILCDFCGTPAWANDTPCVEGHQGSIICGKCLTVAYELVINQKQRIETEDQCRMCLEHRDENGWQGAFEPPAIICVRCVKQASGALNKSKHWDWTKPSET